MLIQVRRTVRPPDGTSLPELILDQVNSFPRGHAAGVVAKAHCYSLLAASSHQLIN
ncbi:hypothetical protein [Caballeronia sp. dw_276]|uniref:hypothetical protein n=1 Tax=Caballeronia sp. dw_276 TaxID=2719795 RepID=UPI001BD564EE|nr:hypothetical protein [Caballeronia sp. dw_276]